MTGQVAAAPRPLAQLAEDVETTAFMLGGLEATFDLLMSDPPEGQWSTALRYLLGHLCAASDDLTRLAIEFQGREECKC